MAVGKVEQDYLRRIVLGERDKPGGLAPELIRQTVRLALDYGYHVVLEGILHTAKYAEMVKGLLTAHRGGSFVFYLDVSLEETLRRHVTRPQATEVTCDQLRGWYLPNDLLGVEGEHVIPEESSFEESLSFIAQTAGFPLDGIEPGAVSVPSRLPLFRQQGREFREPALACQMYARLTGHRRTWKGSNGEFCVDGPAQGSRDRPEWRDPPWQCGHRGTRGRDMTQGPTIDMS